MVDWCAATGNLKSLEEKHFSEPCMITELPKKIPIGVLRQTEWYRRAFPPINPCRYHGHETKDFDDDGDLWMDRYEPLARMIE